jgi:predicted nucleic acid-binding protein
MIAFFDSSVHIGLLRNALSWQAVQNAVAPARIRLSPIVASELLRGATGRAARTVEDLIARTVSLEPPSWRRCWIEAGRLLPKIFPRHEELGLAQLQNDCLLALTARYTGASFLTADAHFESIRRHVQFDLRMLPARSVQ